MDRRLFLGGLAAGGALATPGAAFAQSADGRRRLTMPQRLDTTATGRLDLMAQPGETDFLGTGPSATAGFNQGFLGPTIVMRNDGALAVRVGNRLGETATVHWHGLVVPGEHDGGPHSPIRPGGEWAVEMALDQPPATVWYHSHAHGSTARHVYYGLAGVIHLTDGRDDARGLPVGYGIDDLTLVIQDRRFDPAGRLVYAPDTTDILNGFLAGRILVNGQVDRVAAVPRGLVRLRLLNGSNARFYGLHFDDRRPMHLIATDGGYLPRPRAVEFLRMAPGERAEVLVDFAAGGDAPVLMSALGLPMRILPFAVDDTLPARITRLPDALDAAPFIDAGAATRTRRLALNMGGGSTGISRIADGLVAPSGAHARHGAHAGRGAHAGHGADFDPGPFLGGGPDGLPEGVRMSDFSINGRPYDMRRIDFEATRGTVERWTVTGGGAIEHPFHVHGVQFQVLSVGGGAPRPEDSGWKDTVVLAGATDLLVRFDRTAGPTHPYMYHCHILEHEDAGMMGQFTVA
jgi:blue copper oxidase